VICRYYWLLIHDLLVEIVIWIDPCYQAAVVYAADLPAAAAYECALELY
jgi:hypothetical protein